MAQKTNKFVKGRIYRLPVKEKRTENGRAYYVVVADGKEYAIKLFDFQKEEDVPETLSCTVKDVHEDDTPVLIQDFSPLLRRFYQVGETYPFRVRADCTQGELLPYYEVADSHNFHFRLIYFGNAVLHVGQRICCRVRRLQEHRLSLELAEEQQEESEAGFWLPEDLLRSIGASGHFARWMAGLLQRPEFDEAREAFQHKHGEWLLIALEAVGRHINRWLKPGGRHNGLLLDYYAKACLCLLEDSDYLSGYDDAERFACRRRLSHAVTAANGYRQAIALAEEGRQEAFVDEVLQKVRKSGYIYRLDERFRVLQCVFCLDSGLMDSKMPAVFSLFAGGRGQQWKGSPFRLPFLRLLDLYVQENRPLLDNIAVYASKDAQAKIGRVILALALCQLLAADGDPYDRQLNRARLYRYAALLNGSDAKALVEKAFYCLARVQVAMLEYGWNDLDSINLLCHKLSYPNTATTGIAAVTQTYENKNVQLRITDNTIQLLPSREMKKAKKALPEWLLPWHGLQVLLDKNTAGSIVPGTRDLSVYRKMWKELDYALFYNPDEDPLRRKSHKVMPDVGDIVPIRVLASDPLRPGYFRCRVEDEACCGEGWLCLRNVVRYNLHVGKDAFYSEVGKPYILRAEVQGINGQGECAFNMLVPLAQFVRQNVSVGDEVLCVVCEEKGGCYNCISDYAYQLTVLPGEDTPPLNPGDYVVAKVADVNMRGTITAEYVRPGEDRFKVEEVFGDLMKSYAQDRVYEEEETIKEEDGQGGEVMLEEGYVEELMHLINSVAMQQEERIVSYNYLAMARIFALLVDKGEMAEYFTRRMYFLRLLQQFSINGKVDMEQLKEQGRMDAGLLARHPLLQSCLTELRILSCLDRPAMNPFLWEVAANGADYERLSGLARLSLAYNLLDGFDMQEERQAIRLKVRGLVNLEEKEPEIYTFGEESQHVEFKASYAYPPENGFRADLPRQSQRIMEVICGFLNAEGGTLYLGVNDYSTANGLDMDLAYFGSKDRYDRHIRTNIVDTMGLEANSCVSVDYPDAGDKFVYALRIEPCPHPVKCNGAYFQRQGTSTWRLEGEALNAFLQSRRAKAASLPAKKEKAADPEAGAPAGTPVTPDPSASLPPRPSAGTGTAGTAAAAGEEEAYLPYSIPTSRLRRNVTHSYEEGYGEGVVAYLHLLDNSGYMLTGEEIWRDVLLTLSIREEEADGYLVLVYESGRVLKVPMQELLERTEGREYKRFGSERVIFASPAQKDDALLLVQRELPDRLGFRMDDLEQIKESGMRSKGEPVTSVEPAGVLMCEIIPAGEKPRFQRICNLRRTSIGPNLITEWGRPEQEEFRKLGIPLRF